MERPLKRIRQACDPCRRKKSKCPGEKPTCSYCARLHQPCTYSDDLTPPRQTINISDETSTSSRNEYRQSATSLSKDKDTATRLSTLETQLAEVLSVLKQQQRRPTLSRTPDQSVYDVEQPIRRGGILTSPLESLPLDLAQIAAQLYLDYCDCQPLPLFHTANFIQTLETREPHVVLAIASLALRFDDGFVETENTKIIPQCAELAGAAVMRQVIAGTVELSTLQALCLLALVEFYHSNTQKASIYVSLAADLSQHAGLSWSCTTAPENVLHEEQLRCFWSIRLLLHLHANLLGAFSVSIDDGGLLVYPSSSPRPPLEHARRPSFSEDTRSHSDHKDLGIVAYVIQLSDVWQRAVRYARRRRQPENYPPWSTESDYAKILAMQMDRESMMPYSKHRFKAAHFAEHSTSELNASRAYWGPWLLNQMLYHAIICLLNHPLLLSLRLRSFRVATISEIWLQHTDDLVASHTRWIIHLIELVESKAFTVSDPFLAHFAAIVATIYLQQSFVEDPEVQQNKREGYLTSLRFCEQIGRRWTHIQNLTAKLRRFESMVSTSYQNSAASSTRDKVYIDLTLFWEILESSLVSEEKDVDGLKLGSSLAPRHHPSANAEELSAHPLPEPSRLHSVITPSTSSTTPRAGYVSQFNAAGTVADPTIMASDDFAVLAQSYFAQGQDFVGGLDDWWTLSQV